MAGSSNNDANRELTDSMENKDSLQSGESTSSLSLSPSPALSADSGFATDDSAPSTPDGSFNRPIFPTPALLRDNPFLLSTSTDPAASALRLAASPHSSSGFDMLAILAKVVGRPNPRVQLGMVDMACSFCVVDVHRPEKPIIYASPNFFTLTGYEESDIIGKNCRFLQSPDGHIDEGEPRLYTSPKAVGHLKESLSQDVECQTTLINYRKGGEPFVNLVTVVPVTAETGKQVQYHVGFQIDITDKSNAVVVRSEDGRYVLKYKDKEGAAPNASIVAVEEGKELS